MRGNLTAGEAETALANVVEATIAAVLSAVEEDFRGRRGQCGGGAVAAVVLGNLARGKAAPETKLDVLFVNDGDPAEYHEALCHRFFEALRTLSRDSLLVAPWPRGRVARPVRSLADFSDHHRSADSARKLPDLTWAPVCLRVRRTRDREALRRGAARNPGSWRRTARREPVIADSRPGEIPARFEYPGHGRRHERGRTHRERPARGARRRRVSRHAAGLGNAQCATRCLPGGDASGLVSASPSPRPAKMRMYRRFGCGRRVRSS